MGSPDLKTLRYLSLALLSAFSIQSSLGASGRLRDGMKGIRSLPRPLRTSGMTDEPVRGGLRRKGGAKGNRVSNGHRGDRIRIRMARKDTINPQTHLLHASQHSRRLSQRHKQRPRRRTTWTPFYPSIKIQFKAFKPS